MTTDPADCPPRPPAPAPEPPSPAPPGCAGWSAAGTTTPAWVRPALLALLAATGVLYLWDLAASGWANAFYSAAAQAGSANWEAFFYGSSDAGQLDHRRQAPGLAVGHGPVGPAVRALLLVDPGARGADGRRHRGRALPRRPPRRRARRGPARRAAMALTPVAVLMFRFNNPDALLVLLLTLAAYALTRATEKASGRWLALVGVLVGFALPDQDAAGAARRCPAFALVYLVAAPDDAAPPAAAPARRRAGDGGRRPAGGWPSSSSCRRRGGPTSAARRPTRVWELIWGYNGLGRLTGYETGSVGGGGGNGGGSWGATGIGRMFAAEIGGQVAWLLPAALVLLAAGLVAVGRAPRTDLRRGRAAALGRLAGRHRAGVQPDGRHLPRVLHGGAWRRRSRRSSASAAALLWQRREPVWARIVLASTLAGTARVVVRAARPVGGLPALAEWLVLVAGLLVAARAAGRRPGRPRRSRRRWPRSACWPASAGRPPTPCETAGTAHTGSIPSAGPTVGGGTASAAAAGAAVPAAAAAAAGFRRSAAARAAAGRLPGGGCPAWPGATAGGRRRPGRRLGRRHGRPAGRRRGERGGRRGAEEDASSYTWAAAAVGANTRRRLPAGHAATR